MSESIRNQTMFWEIQVSIAKAIASSKRPSLVKLHHDILEEIGQPPSKKLLDYFLEIVEISSEEKEEYFQYIGISKKRANAPVTVPARDDSNDPRQLAESIASGDTPTVLRFRQAHIKEYGEPPSTELIEFFLKKIPDPSRAKAATKRPQSKQAFVDAIAAQPDVTVLKFRESFAEQFGEPPSSGLTQHFLKKLQGNNGSGKTTPPVPDTKRSFAEDAVKQNIATILQFRQEYEKLYNEAPTNELIDIFIKNLSNN